MIGLEFRATRARLGLTRAQFARLIGYTGTDRNDEMRIKKYESGRAQIPLYIARLVWLIDAHYKFNCSLPSWPHWPDYEYDHEPDNTPEDA